MQILNVDKSNSQFLTDEKYIRPLAAGHNVCLWGK